MRKIEREIVEAMREAKGRDYDRILSSRDGVFSGHRDKNVVFYRLHGTYVCEWWANGDLMFRTGGWQTPTTKSRINAICDGFNTHWGVYQNDWSWYWWNARDPESKPRAFRSGDLLHFDGGAWVVKRSEM